MPGASGTERHRSGAGNCSLEPIRPQDRTAPQGSLALAFVPRPPPNTRVDVLVPCEPLLEGAKMGRAPRGAWP